MGATLNAHVAELLVLTVAAAPITFASASSAALRPTVAEALHTGAAAARLPDITVTDFQSEQEIDEHIGWKNLVGHGFTSLRLRADIARLFESEHVLKSWTILELGTAQGHTTQLFSELFHRVIAVDLDPKLHRTAAARGVGAARGNVLWLTLDVYRDPFWPALVGNDIHVVMQDAGHTEEEVSADLRAISKLKSLHYVIIHDCNFARIRRAVENFQDDFEVVTALGEGRRAPLDERPPGAGPRDGAKFAEALLLRPKRLTSNVGLELAAASPAANADSKLALAAVDAAVKSIVDEHEARRLSVDTLPSAWSPAMSRDGSPRAVHGFPGLCGSSFHVADEHDVFGSDALRAFFKCKAGHAGRRGVAILHELGRNATQGTWSVQDEDFPPEVAKYVRRSVAPWGWVKLQFTGRRDARRSYILVPSASHRALLWLPSGSGPQEAMRIAVEQSTLSRSLQLALDELSPRAIGPWGHVTGPLLSH